LTSCFILFYASTQLQADVLKLVYCSIYFILFYFILSILSYFIFTLFYFILPHIFRTHAIVQVKTGSRCPRLDVCSVDDTHPVRPDFGRRAE